jgi:hypothetical protein
VNTSEQLNEIAAALTKAQAAMKNAALNKVNPHFKSKYADLAGIRDTVVPALTANGIAVVQTLAQGLVLTRLIHTSGQWIESACPIPTAPDMQKMGSAITYARRYSLSAICGISADEDDDGNAAVQATQAKPVAAVPAGFQDWLDDLASAADSGTEALKTAWTKSKTDYRNYLTSTNNEMWETLKARASKVKVSA